MNAAVQELTVAEAAEVQPYSPPAPATQADQMLAIVERMASDPTIDLERVKTIMGLRKSMKDEAAREAFNAAMAACKAELPQVVKNAENTDNKSRYATLDKIGEAVDYIIAKHGFSTSFNPAPCDKPNHLKVECLVAHSAGHERRYEAELPVDAAGIAGRVNKTAIHAWKSTMTYARRTLTEMIFDVKSKVLSPDDDGRAAGKHSDAEEGGLDQAEIEYIETLLKETGSDRKAFLEVYKVSDVSELVALQYKEAVSLLNQKKRRAAAKGGSR
jgi:hypothetical protein